MRHHSVTGIKLVREQENPLQEKHRQVPRRGQHVRSEDRGQRHQRVSPRQPGQLAVHPQLSWWIPFAMLSARPADTVTASQPARCTVHRASTRTAAGRMLRLLHQWHRQQKDPGASIQTLPTEYIHPHPVLTENKQKREKIPRKEEKKNLKHGLPLLFTVLKQESSATQFVEALL